MPTAIVTINGRKARITGATREAVQAKIDELTQQASQPQQEPQTHTMPDGTQMAGATHQEPKRRANFLDLLSLGTLESATQSGKAMATVGKNIPSSAARTVGDIGKALVSPVQTAKAVGQVALGGLEKLIPLRQQHEEAFDSAVQSYVDRYGSLERAKNEIETNPIGFMSDVAALSGAVGGAAKGIGALAKAPKIAQAGQALAKAGQQLEPLTQAASAVGKGLSKVKDISPFAKSVDTGALAASQRLGVDLPASALSTSKAPELLESIAAKGFFGKPILEKLAKAESQISSKADDILRKTGGATDASVAGKSIADAMDKYHANYIAQKNKLYKDAKIGKDISVSGERTAQLVDSILKSKEEAAGVIGTAEDIKFFKSIKAKLSKKGTKVDSGVLDAQGRPIQRVEPAKAVTGQEFKAAINELNEKMKSVSDPLVTGNKAKMRKLVATMAEDLDEAIAAQKPELAESLTAANEYYKSGIEKLNSTYGKSIQKFADAKQYDKIVPAIIKPTTSADDIPRIMEVVGAEGKANIQASVVKSMLEKAQGKEGRFTPAGLSRELKKMGNDKLAQILTPDQMQQLTDIAEVTQALGSAKNIMQGSQTAFVGRIATQVGLLAGGNVTLGLKLLLGDFLASKFIASPQGQAVLSTGLKTPRIARAGQQIQQTSRQVAPIVQGVRQAGIATEDQR